MCMKLYDQLCEYLITEYESDTVIRSAAGNQKMIVHSVETITVHADFFRVKSDNHHLHLESFLIAVLYLFIILTNLIVTTFW